MTREVRFALATVGVAGAAVSALGLRAATEVVLGLADMAAGFRSPWDLSVS